MESSPESTLAVQLFYFSTVLDIPNPPPCHTNTFSFGLESLLNQLLYNPKWWFSCFFIKEL